MADPANDLPTPRPPLRPGQPLPRLRYTPPPEEAPPEADGAIPKKSKRSGKPKGEDEPKGTLVEQTPMLDTLEGRRRVRVVVGTVLAVLAVVSGLLLVRAMRTDDPYDDDFEYADLAEPSAPMIDRADLERIAQAELANARRLARPDDPDTTLRRLDQIRKVYPETAAAVAAREALDRNAQGLPPFGDAPPVVAGSVASEPAPVSAAEVVREPPAADASPATADVSSTPPSVPPAPEPQARPAQERPEVVAKPLPRGFRARPEAGVHPSGWPLEITCDRDGSILVLIPGGTFTQGRNDGPSEERPAHPVTLSPYYIDQHEVTVRQYRLFRPSADFRRAGTPEPSPELPATHVTARDAADYARWAGKSLPTEAQWEMAARTDDGRVSPWGSAPADWKPSRSPGQLDPVMSFPLDRSPYGAFDLAGNVREWTADWFHSGYYDQFRTTPAIDPQGPPPSRSGIPLLTVKGGSPEWIVTRREGVRPTAQAADLGFRCVLNVVPPARPPQAPSVSPDRATAPSRPSNRPPAAVPF